MVALSLKGITKAEEADLCRQAAELVRQSPALAREIVIEFMMADRVRSQWGWAESRLLEELWKALPRDDCNSAYALITIAKEAIRARRSRLGDREVWEHLGLPLALRPLPRSS